MQALLRELYRVAASGIDPNAILAMVAVALGVTPPGHTDPVEADDEILRSAETPLGRILADELSARAAYGAVLGESWRPSSPPRSHLETRRSTGRDARGSDSA